MAHEEQKAVIASKAIDLRYFVHNGFHHFVFPPSQVENQVKIETLALLISGAVQKSIGNEYTMLPDELSQMLAALFEAEKGRHLDRITITAGYDGDGVEVGIYPGEVFVSSVD
jgi:hypothetical protein